MIEGGPEMWLTCEQLATLVNIPVRTARHAMRQAAEGKPVKKWPLKVRITKGKGGHSGKRYEVALSSLSEDLQSKFNGVEEIDAPELAIGRVGPVAPNQSRRIYDRYRVIQEAIEAPKRSAERKAEIERAARKWNIPVRTIHRWIADLEASGGDMNALGRKRPADAGAQRVYVSRHFDKAFLAAGYPADMLPELGETVTHLIKCSWTSPAQRAGWKQVRRVAMTKFHSVLTDRGLLMPREALEVSQRRIMDTQHYRMVDIAANDRKRFDDMKPRIRRNNALFLPMQQVVMDVKPLDNIVRRADGSTTWPKMIAFMDTGTHRVFRHFVMLPPGEGVRQEHVADAFIRMVMHPEWGFPQQLYRDNGSEFAVLDMVRDALALINEPGARTIINAKPYSGASKPIESKFAVLDRFVFSQMGGWAGGNRMNKKTQTVGKPPAPYPGTFEDFAREADGRIEVFEHEKIGSGPFKGRSPVSCLADRIAEGWRPLMVDPIALDAAFCKRETRRVDRGAVSIDGTLYRHPELPNGRTVTIALPWRRGVDPLVDIPGLGWAMLQPDMLFLPGQIEGAIESSRMQRTNERTTKRQRKEAPPVDLGEIYTGNVVALPSRAAPAPMMDALASQQAQEMAAARLDGERAKLALPDAAERRRAARMRETEDLEKYLANKKR